MFLLKQKITKYALLKPDNLIHNRFFMKSDNITVVISKFAKKLKQPIQLEKINQELLLHPDYPSLLCISDILNIHNISNVSIRLKYSELKTVACPFIAHTYFENGEFVVVDKIDEDYIFISNQIWNNQKLDLPEFEKAFSGIVLKGEPILNSVNFIGKITPLKRTALVTGMFFFSALLLTFHSDFLSTISYWLILLLLLKTFGLIVSILLVTKLIDGDNSLINKICERRRNISCNKILSSEAAKIFRWLSWSEIGLFYFTSTFLLTLFGNDSTSFLWFLTILNFASLPYTFYSIYYQMMVAKSWCVLCCIIQTILWMEAILFAVHKSYFPVNIIKADYMTILSCIGITVISWFLLKPLLLKVQQIQPLKLQLRGFKYNEKYFELALSEQQDFVQPKEDWAIQLGNVEAEHIITVITNPYCLHCIKAHSSLSELLKFRADFQARIILVPNESDDQNEYSKLNEHLIALNDLNDQVLISEALDSWYKQKQKKYFEWAKKYPVKINDNVALKLAKHYGWCELAGITGTPTILIDGRRLPDSFQISELKYMLR